MSKLDLNQASYTFKTDALSNNELRVLRFSGREAISQPFVFMLQLVSDLPKVDLDAQVNTRATLSLRGLLPSGERYFRYVHGVVESFRQVKIGKKYSLYQAVLVPTLGPLKYRRGSRIFQKLTTAQIVKKILQDAKVPSDRVNQMLHGSYGERDFCVQYQESDLHFIQRLLEEDGIFYFFEHDQNKDVLEIGDGEHAFVDTPHLASLRCAEHPHLYEEVVYDLHAESNLRSGGVRMRDYRFKQPNLDLEVEKEADSFGDLEVYLYPGEYVEQSLGERLAKTRRDELQHDRQRLVFQTSCRALLPGYTFELSESGRDDFDGKYLVLSVEHQGSQPQALKEEQRGGDALAYSARVVCIPHDAVYRPPRITHRPIIPGVQVAVVVGPPGEEIHCDEHGRVKVQFPWDRQGKKNDDSSCWIRVSQPWGGTSFGGMFIPRIGQEVLVQFLEGDPDRPVIIGRVYNGENQPPYPLPDKKNISTLKTASTPGGDGYNELRFDDTAGQEEVFLHGQLDMKTQIERDRAQTIGRDNTDAIGHDRQRMVGNDETISIAKDQSITVGSNQTLHVASNRSVLVGANQSTAIGGNQAITTAGQHTETITGAMTLIVMQTKTETVAINHAQTVGAAMELSVGGALTESVGAAKTATVGGILTETIGADHAESVGGDLSLDVAGQTGLQAGKEIALQAGQGIAVKAGKHIVLEGGTKISIAAADEIALKAGSAQIILKKSGDVIIKGKAISVKGSGEVVIKGSKISENC